MMATWGEELSRQAALHRPHQLGLLYCDCEQCNQCQICSIQSLDEKVTSFRETIHREGDFTIPQLKVKQLSFKIKIKMNGKADVCIYMRMLAEIKIHKVQINQEQ